jgi:hypothetical protein
VTVPNSVLAEVKKCKGPGSWKLSAAPRTCSQSRDLEPVAELARDWFLRRLVHAGAGESGARRGFSRRCAFELWSRQKMQSSFRLAQDDEI